MPTRFLSDEQRQRYGRFAGPPTEEQLARYFHLDAADRELIDPLRGDHNRIGFALQLGTVRFLGTFPASLDDIPQTVVAHLARQLGLGAAPMLDSYWSERARKRHAAIIRARYGFRELAEDDTARFRLVCWLYTLCWSGDDRPSLLIDRASGWMVGEKILLPGISTVERLVARVRDRAHRRFWRLLTDTLTTDQRQRIDGLFHAGKGGFQTLDALRTPPSRRKPTELSRHLQRIDAIRSFDLTPGTSSRVPMSLVLRLAKLARTARPSAIAALKEPRRTATTAALFHSLEAVAIDDAVELFDAIIADIFREAARTHQRNRLHGLGDLDAAAFILRDMARHVLVEADDELRFIDWRQALFAVISSETIESAAGRVDAIAEPKDDRNYTELRCKWRTVQHLFRNLLQRIEFGAVPAGQPILAALTYLAKRSHWAGCDMSDAPAEAVHGGWKRHALAPQGTVIDNKAYVFAVLESWRTALRKRDVFVKSGIRFGDPRRGLLEGEAWHGARSMICRSLDKSLDAEAEVEALTRQLDEAYRRVASTFEANPTARIGIRNGKPELAIAPLDRIDDSDSLIRLRAAVRARMPRVDLPDILLEIANRTGLARYFTHVTERHARVDEFEVSLCAALLAEACNIGFEPITEPALAPLRRDRLSWVSQNFIRTETIAAANACIVAAHNALPIVRHWGAGDVASADGLRFTAPDTVIHAGPNAKYFKTGRGITLYNLVSDQFTGLDALVVPGTLRDSMFILALLLEQETDLEPTEIMSDTAAYSDLVFGLFWLLGYQFSPRLADIGQARLWRVDRTANYGALDQLVRHRANTKLITPNWEDVLRLVGSLKLGHIHASGVMRALQVKEQPTALAKAIAEIGRIVKSMHILSVIEDDNKRRRILTQLNRQEYRHKLARRVCHGGRGEIKKLYRQGQEEQLGVLGLTVNIITYWNAIYMQEVLNQLESEGWIIDPADIARLSPLIHKHINFLGRYAFLLPEDIALGGLRPLRNPTYEHVFRKPL